MVGQGRPDTSCLHLLDHAPHRRPWVGRVLVALVAWLCAQPILAADPTMQVRIAWGGGADRQWRAVVRSSVAKFSELCPLGIEADTPGSMWIDGPQLIVQQRSPRGYDSLDVNIQAPLDAVLTLEITADEADAKPHSVDFRLADLVSGFQVLQLDEGGNRALVRRSPGDSLRVKLDRDNLVFSPGESLRLELRPDHLAAVAGAKLRIKAQLIAARTAVSHGAKEFEFKTPAPDTEATPIPIEFELPGEEGVYELLISAVEEGLRQRLGWSKPLVERRVQLVVISPKKSPAAPTPWTTLVEIDPANPRWYERLKPLAKIPGVRLGSFGNGGTQTWNHTLGQLVQIGPAGEAPNMNWEAYSLPISKPGTPHILEVSYPSDLRQALGISVLEPNAAGAMTPIQLDSGFYTTDDPTTAAGEPRWAKHSMVFWPKTKTPLILFTNRRDGSQAVFGKIRVLSGPARLPPSTADAPTITSKPRMIAGYFNRPLLAENFSASEGLDASTGRSLDDWVTFHEAGTRLADYLHYAGQNGAMVAVLADGGTIYPSQRLQPSPRYDTGAFFDDARDPLRKDALELLLRVFDREGLRLTPALQFAAPLPELEALLRSGGPESMGIAWIGPEGLPLAQKQTANRGLAPYYNVLNPRVQTAMLGVVREVTQRYGHHKSFAGLGLELTSDGYAQLPGDQWGLDDDTFKRFLHDCQLSHASTGVNRYADRAKFVMSHRKLWQQWRCEMLADFYRRIQAEVATTQPTAKLYLAATNVLDRPQWQRELRPALVGRTKTEEVLLSLGLQPRHYDAASGIVLLRPQHLKPPGQLASQAVDLETNHATDVDRLYLSGSAGNLFFHEPQKARLESFDAKSPLGKAKTYTWLVSQLSPSGLSNRARFAHALAIGDAQCMFDGGSLMLLGQEEAVRPLLAAYRHLPAVNFKTVADADTEGEIHPVVLRTAVVDGQSLAYLVNDSPWPANVTVPMESTGAGIEELTGTRKIPQPVAGLWKVELEPYDVIAVRLTGSRARLSPPRFVFSPDVVTGLETRVQDLLDRVTVLSSPPPLPALTNPGFEAVGSASSLLGWSLVEQAGAAVALETTGARSGGQAVRLTSSGAVASLRSDPFEAPQSGRLSYSVWLRVADAARQPPLRLALEGVLDEKPYYRLANIGAGSTAAKVREGWAQFVFQVDDLPLDGLSQLRVRFDLMGAGEVWIDEIQLFDLAFSDSERVELNKLLEGARVSLKQNKIAECAKILDGYWPRFLLANVPLSNLPVADQRGGTPAADPVEKPAEEIKPGKPRLKIPFKFLSERK